MPVARIVTHLAPESPALEEITEQLRAAGYEVVVAEPGSGGAADVVIEVDQVAAREVLDAALRMARESDADLYVAPGLLAVEATPEAPGGELAPTLQEQPAPAEVHIDIEPGGVVGATLEELGAALAEGRVGIRETISGMRARAAEAWAGWQQHRAEAARQRRLERERRDLEREQRRREHELELQRRADEKQQWQAENERRATEQERLLREQMAREAARRAEGERVEREAMAREAARRAELAHAQELERRRAASIEAERLRALRDQETQPAAFADQPREPSLSRVETESVSAPFFKPRAVRPPRRLPGRRERQWQRAAFIASVATLAAMLGFSIAANMSPSAPLPNSLMENSAQQEVPFGPARMAPTKPKPQPAQPAAVRVGPAKPSPAKPAPQRNRRTPRVTKEREIVAEDEVVVRHLPSSRPRVQTQRGPNTAGVRRYSDDN